MDGGGGGGGDGSAWKRIRFGRIQMSSLFDKPFTKIYMFFLKIAGHRPIYLVLDCSYDCSKLLITRHRKRIWLSDRHILLNGARGDGWF